MAPLPGTDVLLSNGKLGKISPSEDGVSLLVISGVAVAGKFALGDVLGPYVQLEDAVDDGIDAAYDTTNTTKAYKHIADFYQEAPKGTKLYVMVVAKTQTLTNTCLNTNTTTGLKKALVAAEGAIKLVGLTFTPDPSYTPTFDGQLEADLFTAITNLKTLWNEEFTLKRPFRAIAEGRNWQGAVATTKDLRASATTPDANMVAIMIGNDNSVGGTYASVGLALGRAAAVKVNRNIGRVKNGPILSLGTPGLSNGALLSTLTDTQQDSMNDKGYVFFRKHVGKSGSYFNDDHTACPLTDDYSQLLLGRVIDKIVRIVHTKNTDEILDEIEIDPLTGKMDISTVKHYQDIIEEEVNKQMGGSKKEIASIEVFIDPDQNVNATSKIVEVAKAVPHGTNRKMETTVEYENPLA